MTPGHRGSRCMSFWKYIAALRALKAPIGVWFSCFSHTSVPNAAATCGHTYCGVGGTSVAMNCRRGLDGGAVGQCRRLEIGRLTHGVCGIHGVEIYATRSSTVTVQLCTPNHSTGPLLYMALQTKQDHRLPAQLAARLAQRIETHALRPGTRLPSIRNCAEESRVSRSTVVEAYDQLIAAGPDRIAARLGFLRAPARATSIAHRRAAAQPLPGTVLDVSWLLRAQRRQSPGSEQPGAGLLPEDWLDHEMVAAAVRGVGRSRGSWLLKYGAIEGYLPLREALSTRLAQAGIDVAPEQIVTSAGATEAIDLVARRFLAPGDLVFVEDPAWFVMFARFAAFGARIVGVPRGADGPDIAALESLLARERPKLFILNSVAHNPTGSCMSAAVAARVLELAARHDFMILEDDIYGDLQGRHAVRLASLDDGRRVIYVGGFSKTLAANLRVGFVAAHPALARELRDIKALTGLVVERARRARGGAHHHRAQLRTHARTPAHQAR